jgi:hypothetical protein
LGFEHVASTTNVDSTRAFVMEYQTTYSYAYRNPGRWKL